MNKELKEASKIPTHIRSLKYQYKKGIFVEVGAGCPVYNKLCQYPNTASKLVYSTESPNDWNYNQKIYGHTDIRAVSAEVLNHIIDCRLYDLKAANKDNIEVDYILTNTVQIANTDDKETHGWFGIYELTTNRRLFYHFTIPNYLELSRPEQISIISEIGIDLLRQKTSEYVDIILDQNLETDMEHTLSNLKICRLEKNSKNNVNSSVVFTKNGETLRLTEFLRKDFDSLVLFKGSFDPIHDQHISMLQSAKDHIGENTYGVFCISIMNREIMKHGISIDNLIKRIKLINALGFSVIIDRLGYFQDNYKHLSNNPSFITTKKMLFYVLGADTFERLLQDNIKSAREGIAIPEYNCRFLYTDRNNIEIQHGKEISSTLLELEASEVSSTQIREALVYNDIEKLKGLVSDELYAKYKEVWIK